MKTLVIHPKDITTDFLKEIYTNTDFTVINENVELKDEIKKHDRIIMLGHGCPSGLFGFSKMVIDDSFATLLKDKFCICIWCNADKYVEKHNLKGFYTGMFISECYEASAYRIKSELNLITESNNIFAKAVGISLNDTNMLENIKNLYNTDCEVSNFNKMRLYYKS